MFFQGEESESHLEKEKTAFQFVNNSILYFIYIRLFYLKRRKCLGLQVPFWIC